MSVIINPSKLVSSVRAYHSGKVKQIGGGAPGAAAADVIAATDAAAEVVAVPSAADIGDVVSVPSVSFESSFLQTQLSNINNIYNDKTADLNLIYPLYQALKRNLIPLPSVDYYNMVLDSIERRSLDNNCGGLACVENRLTTLLLVYQDLLESGLRPSIDTYNIVIGSLLKGALDAIKLGNQSNTPQFVYHNSFYKSQEFSQIGLDLLLTVKSKANQLDLNKILPNLLIIMNYHPNLVTKQFLDLLFDLKDGNFVANGEYHVGFLGLTKYFGKLKVFNDTNDDLFQFIISSYKCYQQHCQKYDHLIQNEYDVYSSLVQSLIENGNVLLATKFLDQILVDFKESLNSVDKPSKSQISKLLSTYLISLLNIDGSFKNLYRSYNLLQEFNSVAYLPELSVELYNEMINCFISYYTRLEAQKLNSCGPGSESEVYKVQQSQLKYYHIIWKLYNHLAIRKDYQSQQKPFDVVSIVLNNKKISCRDYLLSFSLDLGDHEKIFQLLKEIILKNHIIQDLTILEKLCQYLANGSKINSNSYYNELLWNLLEDQALHYSSNPTDLNSFLLEIVGYLVLESPDIQFNSTKRILDSQVVNNAVTNCDLQANNVYGIMKLLQSAMSTTTNTNDHRMLHLVATMINKFEDSDNHYLAVDDEVSLFVEQMKKYFVNNYNSAVVHITHEMQYAGLNLDLEDPTSSVNSSPDQMEFTNSWHTINLCFLLHTSMRVGVQRFVELFEQGYNFNYETWIIIINNRYEDLPIDTYDVTARILELSFSDVVKNDLIASLLALRLDHVITRVVKYLFQHPAFLRNDDLVHHVFDTLSSKTTEHLKKEIAANINTILEYNQTLKWVNKLSSILDSESFVELVKGNKLLFESKTEYTEDELIFLTRYLKSLIFIFKIDESKETLAKYFTKQSVSHYLKVNPEFLEMVTMHYLVSGSYKTILDTLSSVESTSLFTRKIFMLSRILSNQIYQGKDKCFDDLVLFGSRLLTLEPKRMVEIYRGSPFMHETPQLVSLMIQTLINCALLDKTSLPKINMKLEKLFSFIHGTKYKVLDEKVLLKLIHLLTLLNRGDMLNFIVTHGLGSKAIHFRGFEFHIEDEPAFLALMEQAASQLNDAIMSSAIKEFQISLPSALPKTRQYNYELCI
ncbi:RNase P subunit [Scheffersomyces spartinae]|uniref:RNase P subunit n=1 Tax=Scheffersomyces spartinae TaxID=45513 RepID=A0A9P7V6E7_9ASCO|nr:RNase P subunit [Scheffersomyces spartinae]KAG7192045.1 RNase P subunit [Scheffersomyces spartinae]